MKNIIDVFKLFDNKFKKDFFKIQLYTLFISIGNTITIYLYGLVVLLLSKPPTVTTNEYYIMINNIFKFENSKIFFLYFLAFVVVYSCIIALLNFYILKKTNLFSNKIAANIQQKVYKYYLNLDYTSFVSRGFNNKISELVMDTEKMYSLISGFLQSFFHFYNLIFTFILLMFVSVSIALLNILFLASIYFLIYSKFKKIFKKNSELFSNVSASMIEIFNNSLQGFRETKIYKLENLNLTKVTELNTILAKSKAFSQTLIMTPRLFVEALFLFLLLLIIILNYQFNIDQNLFFTLSIFAISFAKLIPSFQNFYSTFSTIKDGAESYKKISLVLKQLYDIENNLNIDDELNKDLKKINKIEIKDVMFKYNDKVIFKDLNFTINRKDKIFINGPSGSGKSTFLDLVTGFISPNTGKILLNDETQNILYKRINLKYLSQNSFLFKGSILENITLKKIIDKNEIDYLKKIISNLFLDDLITNEEDLEKDTGDFANRISGGQKQRILLARALYFKPDLLILDESLNAIDYDRKSKILDYLLSNDNFVLLYVSHDLDFKEKFNKNLNTSKINKILN